MIWDWVCGTIARPCPKLAGGEDRTTTVASYVLPPPCIYVFPGTIASTRNNPAPVAQSLDDAQFLKALQECFRCREDEVNFVDFEVQHVGSETERKTRVRRDGQTVQESKFTAIRRV